MLLLRSINFASWHLIAGKRNATVMIHGAICAALHLRISFDAHYSFEPFPLHPPISPPPPPRLPRVPSRESANHYSKRIMQTRYLIKNIFVFAWSSLLHTDIYRARYRAPRCYVKSAADCTNQTWLRAREDEFTRVLLCERVFNLACVSASRNLRNRALVNYTDARAVICDMYPHSLAERITNKTTKD